MIKVGGGATGHDFHDTTARTVGWAGQHDE